MTSKSGSLLATAYHHSFFKFAIVGAIGVAVNEGLLIAFQAAGLYLLVASVLAIEISIISNFFLNDLWTFNDRRSGTMVARFTKFNVLMLAGLVVNAAVLYAGVQYLGMAAAIANLVGIAVAFVLRYALSVKYAWMRAETELRPPESPLADPGKP